MKIVLWGYGKMGQIIEKIALSRGHEIVGRIDKDTDPDSIDWAKTETVIEFTQPESAFDNLVYCMKKGKKVVCGTTGWLVKKPEIEALCIQHNASFFYASNFSIGVNLFFKLNEQLAQLMNKHAEYDVHMEEIHHIHKKDSPSGTGITLAEGIIKNLDSKTNWVEGKTNDQSAVAIHSIRENEVPGTHSVHYKSTDDQIIITHEAFSRNGFATGAVVVAEWLADKTGVFNMNDFLK